MIEVIAWFLVVLTAVVFVHECGHYLVARLCGVRVEVFSVGFGPEIAGWTDRRGTRWRVSALPVGGYVRFLGGEQPSGPGEAAPERDAFPAKGPAARAAIVAAGPAANFAFAAAVFFAVFLAVGRPVSPPVVGEVVPGGAAEEAGIVAGDRVVAVDGRAVDRFAVFAEAVSMSPGRPLPLSVERGGLRVEIVVVPRPEEWTDPLGEVRTVGRIGVLSAGAEIVELGPLGAAWAALAETAFLTRETLAAFGEILTGRRGTDDLGGPIMIAQVSGQVAERGLVALLGFMAFLSINLGIINLFPIPLLDGGHLVFVLAEAVRGRPISDRLRGIATQAGFAVVVALMIFVIVNDIGRLL